LVIGRNSFWFHGKWCPYQCVKLIMLPYRNISPGSPQENRKKTFTIRVPGTKNHSLMIPCQKNPMKILPDKSWIQKTS
jgi:hypothetical protein